MSVLVTGGDGFTGKYLIPELEAAGWQPISGVRSSTPNNGEITFELTDVQAMRMQLAKYRPRAIIHLAAISFAMHGDIKNIYDTNVLGTLNLLRAIEESALELDHLIVASSAAVYGDQNASLLKESLIPQPRNDYGISKLAAEHIALSRNPAKNLAIFRPFNYTGVGQPHSFLIPKLVGHFVERKSVIELGNINVAREFNDVRWAVKNYSALLGFDYGSCTVNLCSGNAFTLAEVMQILNEVTGHQPEVKINPEFVRENDPPLIAGDIELARRLNLPDPEEDAGNALRQLLSWMCENYKSSE